MTTFDPLKALSYGVIGLGFLLAFLAYRLLTREQSRKAADPNVLRATYVFMFFSLALTCLGLVSEFLRYRSSEEGTNAGAIQDLLTYVDQPILGSVRACTSNAQGAADNINDNPVCVRNALTAVSHGVAAESQLEELKKKISRLSPASSK
jgi:hypothetical protein